MKERLLTINEAKSLLLVTNATIRRIIREKKLIAYKVGNKYLIKESDLIDFINSCKKI